MYHGEIDLSVKEINDVMIVGGGTAGWLTALSLKVNCPGVNLTLVQPKSHGVIGVGESTQPDLIALLSKAQIDLGEFIVACDATMKCGIYYEDWNEIGQNYWHPFSPMNHSGNYTLAHHYQQLIKKFPEKYKHEDYYNDVHLSYDVCVKNKKVDPASAVALHVDADKMHNFLRHKLPSVNVIEPDLVEVLSENDNIHAIVCDGVEHKADLYVDCTGFNKLLMKQISDCKVNYYVENVETAIFARIPYEDIDREMVPYTKAHAVKHGWIWTIPLKSRIGSGYVYTQNSCSKEEAEQEFREYWGIERTKELQFKHIQFSSDALAKPWVNNCVAIGLSSGFVEPLEATGINWIITAANTLSSIVARKYFDNECATLYNNLMKNYVNDVQDFVDVHYKLNNRKDTRLWEFHSMRGHHPRLDMKLKNYKEFMPNVFNRPANVPWAFNAVSWIDILNGYKFDFDDLNIKEDLFKDMNKELARNKSLREGRADKCLKPVDFLEENFDLHKFKTQ